MVGSLDTLAHDLAQPAETGGISLLLELWRHTEITVICRRPLDLEDHPDLCVRVRGAFGQSLAGMSPPVNHRRDPFGRPTPFAVLFGNFQDGQNRPLPKPFVLDVDWAARNVVVRLRVVGRAMFWSEQARLALIAALARGVSIKSESRHRVVFEPEEVWTEVVDGIETVAASREARLLLRSPLAIRSRDAVTLDARSLVNSLVARAEGLAAWQGQSLTVERELMTACGRTANLDVRDLYCVRFQRHSRRQQDRTIPVVGLLGSLGLVGPIEPLAPYLVLGSHMHVGSHAALGLGRYELAVYG